MKKKISDVVLLVRGAGEMATGVAHRLASCHFRICLTEVEHPQAVRREVAFSEAIYDHEKQVEGVVVKRIESPEQIPETWKEGKK